MSGVPRSTTARSRWLGIAISVSTTCGSSARPASAWSARLRPSNTKGLVTTATVRIPSSLATDATMGAEPVPVPPPSPAVTNTMSAPSSTFWRRSRSSIAAFLPISGSDPAPSPAVRRAPSWSFTAAGEARRACESVLATMNSTPVNSAPIIRLTAFEPPPPRPMTLILATSPGSSRSNTGCRPLCSIGSSFEQSLRDVVGGGRPANRTFRSEDQNRSPTQSRTRRPTRCTSEPSATSSGTGVWPRAPESASPTAVAYTGLCPASVRVPSPGGPPAPPGPVEALPPQLRHPPHDRRAASQHDARHRHVLESGAREIARHEREDLLDARLDDLRQDVPRELARFAPTDGGHLHALVVLHERGERAPVALLQLLGIARRRAQTDRDVVR